MAPDRDNLRAFYEGCYLGTGVPEDGARGRRWRELGAEIKTDHIQRLLAPIPTPHSILEVGCGDGAVLEELGRRDIGANRVGIDISSAAVAIAEDRAGVTAARLFDGVRIDALDSSYDLAVCTHVLEHVPAPLPLLEEIIRVARAVVIEVPLEHNLLAERRSARTLSRDAGHLQRFDRTSIRELIGATGWRVRSELLDPLPLAVYTFDANSSRALAKGRAKWVARSVLGHLPGIGERLMTLHYSALMLPA